MQALVHLRFDYAAWIFLLQATFLDSYFHNPYPFLENGFIVGR